MGKLYSKLNCVLGKVPKTEVKFAKNGSVISKVPWDYSPLKRIRKAKDKAWKVFEETPISTNLNYALSKQKEYDTKQSQCMIKYENRIMRDMKGKPKRFFSYVNSKKRIKQSVVSVKNASGDLAKSPQETAELLASFFESTFRSEPLGPLPEECYREFSGVPITDLQIT